MKEPTPPPKSDDAKSVGREYRPEEVEALTARAAKLLDELHEVMGEMTQRLRMFLGDQP